MGANQWKHAHSLVQMANDTLKFYLSGAVKDSNHLLLSTRPAKTDFVLQTVDFKDRDTWNVNYWRALIVWDSLTGNNGMVYISDPIENDITISGSFLGQMKASINKKDLDFSINLFEQMPDGKLFYLSYFMGRASYSKNILKRELLTPGKIETIPFTNTSIAVKKISKGSRIVVLVNVNKSPFEQINYGTGKDINEETIKDAKVPLKVKWFNSSYIEIPILK